MPYVVEDHPPAPPRPWLGAMARGALGRCPNCGKGRLFERFLKVAPRCDVCGEELHHQRADDFPPYATMFIVGHAIGAGILAAENSFDLDWRIHLAIWPAATALLTLGLIQPVKGALVAYQWALRMHGFGDDEPAPMPEPTPALPRGPRS